MRHRDEYRLRQASDIIPFLRLHSGLPGLRGNLGRLEAATAKKLKVPRETRHQLIGMEHFWQMSVRPKGTSIRNDSDKSVATPGPIHL